MKLNALRDFLAVAERGGVRAAARHLGLAQPAISRSIAELERNWARRCSSATPRACSSRRSDRPSCAAPPPSTMRSSAPATRRANCAAPSTAASRWACPPPRTWSCSPTCCRRSARAFPTSTWKSSTASIRWSRRAAGRFHGFLRRPGARARAGRAAGREAVRQYPRHPGPQGPSAGAGEIAARTGRRPLDHHVHHPQGRGRTGPAVREAWPARAEAGDAGAIRADLPDGAAQFGPADDAAGPMAALPAAAGHVPGNQGPGEAARAARLHRAAHRTAADAGGRTLLHAAAAPGTSGSGSAHWRPGNRRQRSRPRAFSATAAIRPDPPPGRRSAARNTGRPACCRYCPFRRSSGPGSRAALP